MPHRLWTFRVSGPGNFALQPPGNPSAYHPGGTSVFHFLLTDGQASYVEQTIEGLGLQVEMRAADTQTDAQHTERKALLGVGKTEEDYLSPMCPSCFWFDPTIEGFCGRSAWPTETVFASLEVHEAARKAEADCPVKEW